METAQYRRKSFEVSAVQVTPENINEVAKWCQGDVVENSSTDIHIKVRVLRVLNDRQTQAFVGDWVLYAGKGYKVYTDRAFQDSFEKLDKKPLEATG